MATLDRRLVLHAFMCRQFGYLGMEDMLNALRGVPSTLSVSSESDYARARSA